jgi:hypothetical protein
LSPQVENLLAAKNSTVVKEAHSEEEPLFMVRVHRKQKRRRRPTHVIAPGAKL